MQIACHKQIEQAPKKRTTRNTQRCHCQIRHPTSEILYCCSRFYPHTHTHITSVWAALSCEQEGIITNNRSHRTHINTDTPPTNIPLHVDARAREFSHLLGSPPPPPPPTHAIDCFDYERHTQEAVNTQHNTKYTSRTCPTTDSRCTAVDSAHATHTYFLFFLVLASSGGLRPRTVNPHTSNGVPLIRFLLCILSGVRLQRFLCP